MRSLLLSMLLIFVFSGISHADERVDLIGPAIDSSEDGEETVIVDTSLSIPGLIGEFDILLGSAAALNRALGFIFDGNASNDQVELELIMAEGFDNDYHKMAPFSLDVLALLQDHYPEAFPASVELRPFDLTPSDISVERYEDSNLVAVIYDEEEYLERLLQRLYFKLIQGPVLLTVPYSGGSELVPEEYANWNNFNYASESNTMDWDDTRLVWVDWSLVQTVVLMYEDGLIACYDSGEKYYIDHTAAIVTAAAMLAYPDLDSITSGDDMNFVLTTSE